MTNAYDPTLVEDLLAFLDEEAGNRAEACVIDHPVTDEKFNEIATYSAAPRILATRLREAMPATASFESSPAVPETGGAIRETGNILSNWYCAYIARRVANMLAENGVITHRDRATTLIQTELRSCTQRPATPAPQDAREIAERLRFIAKDNDRASQAVRAAVELCRKEVSELSTENPEVQALRLKIFAALELPTINLRGTGVELDRIAAALTRDRASRPARWWPIHRYGNELVTGPAFDSLEHLRSAREGNVTTLGAFSSEGNLWNAPRGEQNAANNFREAYESMRENVRLIDIAMHGEEGAAKSPSACDLIEPARMLRQRVARLTAERDRFRAAHIKILFAAKHYDGRRNGRYTLDWSTTRGRDFALLSAEAVGLRVAADGTIDPAELAALYAGEHLTPTEDTK
jgi:hypothetical protein